MTSDTSIIDPVGTVGLSHFRINVSRGRYIAVCRCRSMFDPNKFATGPDGHETLEEATRSLAEHIVERHRADVGQDTVDDVSSSLMKNWKKVQNVNHN